MGVPWRGTLREPEITRECTECNKVLMLANFPLVAEDDPMSFERHDACEVCLPKKLRRIFLKERAKLDPDWKKTDRNMRRMRRHARKLNATTAWANDKAILKFYTEARVLTRKTGVKHQVDHIVPLQNDVVCGLHVEANLRVITATANLKKGNGFVNGGYN